MIKISWQECKKQQRKKEKKAEKQFKIDNGILSAKMTTIKRLVRGDGIYIGEPQIISITKKENP